LDFSVSGVVAYEAAQQLRRAGESVPLVVMADTWAPGYIKRLPFIRRFLLIWSYRLRHVKHKFELLLSGKLSVVEFLVSYRLVRQSRIMNLAAALHLVSRAKLREEDGDQPNRWLTLYLDEARDCYLASASVGDVVVLQSDEVVTRFADPKMKWSELMKGRLFVHRVPGWHVEMFQGEGAYRTAEHLRPLLEQVDAERDQMVRSEATLA
jgi:thioesterase domain-containing protein